MPEKLKNHNSSFLLGRFDDPVIPYLPATLKEFESGWLIEYHVANPETHVLERYRDKFQRIRKKCKTDDDARKIAKNVCKERNKQLSTGWHPGMQSGNIRIYTKLTDALNSFLKEKMRELREDSKRTYKSHISIFTKWIVKNKMDGMLVKSFTSSNADDYLYFHFVEEGKSARTYNNYLLFYKGIFNWFISKGYCDKNPFSNLKKKKEDEKKRDIIPIEWDKKIMDYCYHNHPRMAFICMLVYSSFMRPAEICRVKIKDIHIDKSAIFIEGVNAKNAHSRWAILTEDTLEMIKEMGIMDCNPEWYMISTSLLPGTIKKNTRDIDKYWAKMRTAIKMPSEYQLYSYRDTGIMWLKENGVPDYLIIKLTGHKKMDMLDKYSHAPQEEALRMSSQFLPKLGERVAVDHSEKSNYSSSYGK